MRPSPVDRWIWLLLAVSVAYLVYQLARYWLR